MFQKNHSNLFINELIFLHASRRRLEQQRPVNHQKYVFTILFLRVKYNFQQNDWTVQQHLVNHQKYCFSSLFSRVRCTIINDCPQSLSMLSSTSWCVQFSVLQHGWLLACDISYEPNHSTQRPTWI